jgi:hypothetical protein
MPVSTKQLLHDVAEARQHYLAALAGFSEEQAQQKPSPEQGGILGMWKTLLGIRAGTVSYEADRPHEGLPIDEIIRRTWQEKEVVPAVAAPRMGGPLAYWAAALHGLQDQLEAFGEVLTDDELDLIAHPHPISGPMSFGQRLEFLRFHIDRHREQVNRLTVQEL